ncbi:MAG: hypothetical protein ACK4SU_02345 [Dictyoglomus sp.]
MDLGLAWCRFCPFFYFKHKDSALDWKLKPFTWSLVVGESLEAAIESALNQLQIELRGITPDLVAIYMFLYSGISIVEIDDALKKL